MLPLRVVYSPDAKVVVMKSKDFALKPANSSVHQSVTVPIKTSVVNLKPLAYKQRGKK